MTSPKVRVVAYKNRIVIVPRAPKKDIDNGTKGSYIWWPTGGTNNGNGGCVIGPTRDQLGLSKEAIELLYKVKHNNDDCGDLGWWRVDDGSHCFSWWGHIYRIINPDTAEADRDFHVFEHECVVVPNLVPNKAQKVIDTFGHGKEEAYAWKSPYSIYYDSRSDDEK